MPNFPPRGTGTRGYASGPALIGGNRLTPLGAHAVAMQPQRIPANPGAYPRIEGQEAPAVGPLSALAALIESDRPVGWWRLGDLAGTVAADLGSGNNPGAYTGGFTLNQVPLVNADATPSATFDGTTGYINIPDLTAYSIVGTGQLTVMAIVQCPSTPPSGIQNIVAKGSGSGYEWALRWNGTGVEAVAWDSAGATVTAAGGANFWSTTQWASDFAGRAMFVMFTFDNSIAGANPMQLYVNKTTSGSGAKAATPSDTTSPVNIGRRGDNTGYLASTLVQDVAIFGTVLSQARAYSYVDALWNALALADADTLGSSESNSTLPTVTASDTDALGSSEVVGLGTVYSTWGSVTDTFDTPANWFISANAAISGGQGSLSPLNTGANGTSLQTVDLHDLTGTAVSVQWVQVLNQVSGAQTSLEVRPKGLGTNTVLLLLENNLLFFQSNIGGSYVTQGSVTWDAPNMQYWRIRESNGTLYGEVSPDANTWSEVGHWRYLGSPITVVDMQVNLGGGTWTTVASPGTAIVDNLNISIVGKTPSDTSPVASSEATTLSSTLPLTDTEAVTSGETNRIGIVPPATADTEALGSAEATAIAISTLAADSEAVVSSELVGAFVITPAPQDSEHLISAETSSITITSSTSDSDALGSGETSALVLFLSAADTEALLSTDAATLLALFTTTDTEAVASSEAVTYNTPQLIPALDSEALISSETASSTASLTSSDAEAVTSSEAASAVLTALNVSGTDSEALGSTEASSMLATRATTDSDALVSGEASAIAASTSAADTEALGTSEAASVGNPIAATDSTAAVSAEAVTLLYAPTYADATAAASSEVYALQMQATTADSDAFGNGEIVSVGVPITVANTEPVGSSDVSSTSAVLPYADSETLGSAEIGAPTFESIAAADANAVGSVELSATTASASSSDSEAVGSSEQSSVGSPIGATDSTALVNGESNTLSTAAALADADALGSSELSAATASAALTDATLLVTSDDFTLFRLTPIAVTDATQFASAEVLDQQVMAAIIDATPITALEVLAIFSALQLDDATVVTSTDVLLALFSSLLVDDTAAVTSDEQNSVTEYAGKGYPDLSQGAVRADIDVARFGRRTAPFTNGAARTATTTLVRT